eukprot:1358534-Amorphochlora_amoeboformis.AAC.1
MEALGVRRTLAPGPRPRPTNPINGALSRGAGAGGGFEPGGRRFELFVRIPLRLTPAVAH